MKIGWAIFRIGFSAAPELLNFDEAAAYLGCTVATLRKLIDRSRARLRGVSVAGPTMRFVQAHPRAAIKFRRAWLDTYIAAGTHNPEAARLLADYPVRSCTAADHGKQRFPVADSHLVGLNDSFSLLPLPGKRRESLLPNHARLPRIAGSPCLVTGLRRSAHLLH